jgi:hypothetical protein
MLKYRIFTNDRGMVCGVAMYSCLTEVRAMSPGDALTKCPTRYTDYGPVAIRWPKSAQSDDEKAWLKKHVG